MDWHFSIRPGLQHNGKPLTLWARIKIWRWLWQCERRIKRELKRNPPIQVLGV